MNNIFDTPSICEKVVCISSNTKLAAIISSIFNNPNEYFAVFEEPRIFEPFLQSEFTVRNNTIAKIQPRWVILAGLKDVSIQHFQKCFPPQRTIIIQNINNVSEILKSILPIPGKEFICNNNEIALGLLIAKSTNCLLKIVDNAPTIEPVFNDYFSRSRHAVVLDDLERVAPVIAANYAFSINATLKLLPPVNRDDLDITYESILSRNIYRNEKRGIDSADIVLKKEANYRPLFNPTSFDFVTFITFGMPYGYFYPQISSTHLFSFPCLGVTIAESILFAKTTNSIRALLAIDPGFFNDSETQAVITAFKENSTYVRLLAGEQATVYQTRMHIQYFPYDLLFICSHAGQVSGDRYRFLMPDLNGVKHEIVLDSALEFAPPPGKISKDTKIELLDFREFIEFDGKPWKSGEQGQYQWEKGNLIKTLMGTYPKDWEIIEQFKIPYVKNSFRIQASDGYCAFAFHVLADQETPIIFNNSCSSFHSMASFSIYSGAIAYVGTLFPVVDSDAKTLSKNIFESVDDGLPLPFKLWAAQNKIYNNPEHRPYVHFGCHFIFLNSAKQNMKNILQRRVDWGRQNWQNMISDDSCDVDQLESIKSTVDFLGNLRL